MKPFRVEIRSAGNLRLSVRVFAVHQKFALIEFLKSLGEEHAVWNWPGWEVQVFPEMRGLQP